MKTIHENIKYRILANDTHYIIQSRYISGDLIVVSEFPANNFFAAQLAYKRLTGISLYNKESTQVVHSSKNAQAIVMYCNDDVVFIVRGKGKDDVVCSSVLEFCELYQELSGVSLLD